MALQFSLIRLIFPLVILLVTVSDKGKLYIKGLIYQGKKIFYDSLICAHDEDALDFSLNFP